MINTVSYARLELIKLGRNVDGKRVYSHSSVNKETLKDLRKAAAKVFGMVV